MTYKFILNGKLVPERRRKRKRKKKKRRRFGEDGKFIPPVTRSEKKLARIFTDLGIQYETQARFGPYWVDFWIPEARLVIEVDGQSHVGRQELDNKRSRYLRMRGARHVFRIWNGEVKWGTAGLERILRAIELLPAIDFFVDHQLRLTSSASPDVASKIQQQQEEPCSASDDHDPSRGTPGRTGRLA